MDRPTPPTNRPPLGIRNVRFGIFDVDLQTGELRKRGTRIKLHGQPFDILATLLERPGEVVTREELQEKLWAGDTFVDFEHGLNKAINKVREALGDHADKPRFIETLPRRGYRFIASVDGGAPRDIGDAWISLDEVVSGAPEDAPSLALVGRPIKKPWGMWLLSGVAGLLALATTFFAFLHFHDRPSALSERVRFEVPMPEKPALPAAPTFVVSPDGRQLGFFAAGPDGLPYIWVRALDSLEEHMLPGSESLPSLPFFWSPDSRYIAFDGGGKLKKIDISSGVTETICDLPGYAVGGSWNRDGVIIFGTSNGGLMRASANGGSATPLTSLNPSRNETFHDFPVFLSDGRHFIYKRTSNKEGNSGIYVGSLDARPQEQDSRPLLATDFAATSMASLDAGSDHFFFFRDGTVMMQPLDIHRLQLVGQAVPVAEHVGSFLSFFYLSASPNVLVYRTGEAAVAQLTWFDREGKALGPVGEPSNYVNLALSPDGTRAAVVGGIQDRTGRETVDDRYSRLNSRLGNPAVWLLDLSRGMSTRFTFGSTLGVSPVWSPDGNRIIFASNANGALDLYEKLASGVKDQELLLKSSENKVATSVSRDGRFLLYTMEDPKTKKDGVWVLPLEGERKPFPFLVTQFSNEDGQFSPDGRWVSYVSDESGRNEVYVRTFLPDFTDATSDSASKWLISTNGGSQSRWRHDGKELYYLAPDGKLMAVEIATNPVFKAGVPEALFQSPPLGAAFSSIDRAWDVTSDGKRFLFQAAAAQTATPFTVALNWQTALKK